MHKSGPKTAAGKERSSRNALKHGITSSQLFVLQNENPFAWQELLDDCVARHAPQGPLEMSLVREMAFCRWRQQRAWFIENALNDLAMDQQSKDFPEDLDPRDEAVRQALAWRSLSDESNAQAALHRYERSLRRGYERAERNLQHLREKSRPHHTPETTPTGSMKQD